MGGYDMSRFRFEKEKNGPDYRFVQNDGFFAKIIVVDPE